MNRVEASSLFSQERDFVIILIPIDNGAIAPTFGQSIGKEATLRVICLSGSVSSFAHLTARK